ncbi:hypothetical protein [Pseudomonas syringae]|uniref:hypothetical protein n=1 Tax=Pseudomonas syringae TaxID=317 RepID=UPI0012F6F41D|nr:hypothetical protein [Pseudomonas syringae]MCK9749784.1 hypothetical protein [Pseudomonas syringae pv. syringae]MCK9754053.1 hypothetical protein [Pseudomonas syringae pv. syringae]
MPARRLPLLAVLLAAEGYSREGIAELISFLLFRLVAGASVFKLSVWFLLSLMQSWPMRRFGVFPEVFSPKSDLLTLYEVEAWVSEISADGPILYQRQHRELTVTLNRIRMIRMYLKDLQMRLPTRKTSQIKIFCRINRFQPEYTGRGAFYSTVSTSALAVSGTHKPKFDA